MRVLTVIGNRPQFVKAAAVSFRLRESADEVLVHTGQHYDAELSQVFFDELELPRPEHLLDLGGGTNTEQTGRMLGALAPLLASERPDVVLVYGDTNSTLAGALAAAQAGIPVAHVEAGMRSFDRAMPEELNRVLTDHASAGGRDPRLDHAHQAAGGVRRHRGPVHARRHPRGRRGVHRLHRPRGDADRGRRRDRAAVRARSRVRGGARCVQASRGARSAGCSGVSASRALPPPVSHARYQSR